MVYRFCPTCERWLETSEYTVDDVGWVICPDHDISLHGYIDSHIETEDRLRRELRMSHGGDIETEVQAALDQGLVS